MAISSWKYDVNITRIESRINTDRPTKFDFFVDFHGQIGEDANVDALLVKLRGMTDRLLVLDEKEVRIFDVLSRGGRVAAPVVSDSSLSSLSLSPVARRFARPWLLHSLGALVPPTHIRTRSHRESHARRGRRPRGRSSGISRRCVQGTTRAPRGNSAEASHASRDDTRHGIHEGGGGDVGEGLGHHDGPLGEGESNEDVYRLVIHPPPPPVFSFSYSMILLTDTASLSIQYACKEYKVSR